MELVEAIEAGRPLDEVDGLYFKRDGRIVKTGCRATVDIDTLPPLPFDLLDVDRFVALHSTAMSGRLDGRRAATYYSSYGCPFSCSFCSEPMTSNRRWYSKSPERVIDELETLKRDYGVEAVIFEDPIYFVDVRRVKRIAELMIERGLDIVWSATSRLETIKKIDQPTWDILKKAGFIQVFIGIESASPTILKAIGKKYTVDDILDVARIFDEQEITFTGSFIQGIPVKTTDRTLEEITREDMRLASDTVLKIYETNPKAVIYVVLYTPYPGSVAYHLSIENGFVPPESLEGWCDFNHQVKSVPWTLKEQEYFCRTWTVAQKVIRGGRDRARFRRNKLKGSLLYAYGAITRARYRHGYFKYPVEQHLMAKLARRVALARNPDAQANNGMLI
jgi:radical SAM superfamily enzyme YgiQ (UPF0313 family)